MKSPHYPHRRFHVTLAPMPNGLCREVPTIHAPSEAQANEAADFYTASSRPGMDTEARINRAIALHERFDAEARHELVAP